VSLVRILSLLTLSAACLRGAVPVDEEANLQRALAGIYDLRDSETLQALSSMEAARPGLPAPFVYRSLLAYWRAAADPGNTVLLDHFRTASADAVRVSTAWIEKHPNDPEGWRYLASALGQRAQFAVSVAPNKVDIVRYGIKAREAVIKAQQMDPSNKDILIGLGAQNYFAANIPWYLRAIALTLGVKPGDRELGLKQMAEGMNEGPHTRVEGALVLASAMFTEARYAEFYKVVTERVTSVHPALLPVAEWSITGSICGGMTDEALKTVDHAVADDAWRYLQRGRIALGKRSWKEAADAFSKSIEMGGGNRSSLAWAYYGRSLARTGDKQPDGGDMKRAKETSPTAFELAVHLFQRPGACRA
jgi:tetratricopeptide (TPR) repeat protein